MQMRAEKTSDSKSMSEWAPVACVSYASRNIRMCKKQQLVCAYPGLCVVRSPSFPVGDEAGRVGNGVGIVYEDDNVLGNLRVYWKEDGDFTVWTRASYHGFDVVTMVDLVKSK